MGEIEVLYKCIVCGKAYGSKQALRGHMNAHRGKLKRTTIFVDAEKWDEFKGFCKGHNTTTCHMLDALLSLALTGKSDGIVEIAGPNPVIFNYTQNFLGKPRSAWKTDITRHLPMGPACPECGASSVSVSQPEFTEYKKGRCLRCRAEFFVMPWPGAPRPS